MSLISFNGKMVDAATPVLTAQNRGFKYGDGCFETMKVQQGKISLHALHFERLFLTLKLLKLELPLNEVALQDQILLLCTENNVLNFARVRLAVYRCENNRAEYLVEALPLNPSQAGFNNVGLKLGVFAHARKSMDAFANLKTANFLPYVLAEQDAREKGLDDCIVLNSENNICDTSKANIFLIKNERIYTPSLQQGCINGVMRRHIIDNLKKLGYAVQQQPITEQELLEADEVFLTNAISGMRWVQQVKEKTFSCVKTSDLCNQILKEDH